MSPLVRPGGDEGAGHQFGPGLDILLGVAHHGGLAGGAGRGVDPDDLLQGRGKEPVGIGVPHVLLGGEGEPLQVGQGLHIDRAGYPPQSNDAR